MTSPFDVDGVKELSALGVKVRDRVPAGGAVLLPVGDVAKEAG